MEGRITVVGWLALLLGTPICLGGVYVMATGGLIGGLVWTLFGGGLLSLGYFSRRRPRATVAVPDAKEGGRVAPLAWRPALALLAVGTIAIALYHVVDRREGKDPGPAGGEARMALPEEARESQRSSSDEASGELEAARARIAELEARLVEVERGAEIDARDGAVLAQAIVDHAQAEARRWEEATARCVEELNRLGAQAAARRAMPPPAPRSSAGARWSAVRTLAAPQVSIVGDGAVVSARLWNPGEQDQDVTVAIELLQGGQVVDSTTQHVLVPAHGDLAVSAELRARGSASGGYAGRVRVLR